MKYPEKVVIEITGIKYSTTVYDNAGKVIYTQTSEMVTAGQAEATTPGGPHDCAALEGFDDLVEALEDIDFGPFDIAGALYSILEECA